MDHMHSEQGPLLAALPRNFSTDQIFVKAVHCHAMIANAAFHEAQQDLDVETAEKTMDETIVFIFA